MATQAEWQAKVDEIVAEIGRSLFGDGPRTEAQQSDALTTAEEAIEEWESSENGDLSAISNPTPLQRLLAEQHEIAEQVLDLRDGEIRDNDDGLDG
ncbi:hypothetical protein HCU64_22780 [Methylobacterium sp. C25]|uniref:hypothetical protein n=1 Tax=Methylobacterium sp. C25 TaxID=2721622 RepID=UPI001F3A15E2|nr:hypothetical protein [Methylobacterium sp. C25]MCE4226572.1 hypothetical protein [Methylobacterium sp. C25]